MGKRVLVTGGAGFAGSNMIRYILGKYPNYRVINFDSLTSSASLGRLEVVSNNPLYTLIEGDITNENEVQYLFEQYEPDYILHFASQSYVDKSIHQQSIFVQTNVIGTQLILSNVRKQKNAKLVHLSTSKVYGSFLERVEIDEDSRLIPYGPYAASKAAADLFVMAAYRSHNLNVNILRPTNIYGDYQFPEKLIPTVIDSVMKGGKIPLFGSGDSYRDWVHITDFCKAVDLVLHYGESGQTYNISYGESVKNIDIARKIVQQMGQPGYEISFFPEKIGDESYPTVKSEKIRKELRWMPEIDLELGLELTIKWYENHKDWLEKVCSGLLCRHKY